MDLAKDLVAFLIFPGFLFMVLAGMLVSWVDRKVTARVQFRVGPPLLQPLWDLLKLMGKELVIPRGTSKLAFFGAPLLGLAGVVFVGVMVGQAMFFGRGFQGDLIVALYLLVLPSLAVILGGIASKNPLASVGASREMKLILGYELPFLLAVLVPIIQSGGALQLEKLVVLPAGEPLWLVWVPRGLALVVVLLCMQAKMALVPFDQAEAETEIMGGALIEYSGPALAVYKLTKMLLFYAMPMFVVAVFLGGFGEAKSVGGIVGGIVKYLALVVLITLIRNTNPRLRIEHAVRFFWGPVTVLALVAVLFTGL